MSGLGINYLRYQHLASELQKEAYAQQCKANNGKQPKQFIPCNKALVLSAAMFVTPTPVTMQVIPEVALTPCRCHPDLGEDELFRRLTAYDPPEGSLA